MKGKRLGPPPNAERIEYDDLLGKLLELLLAYRGMIRVTILIGLRINNAIFKAKKGEVQTARYIRAKETEKQPSDRFHLPRHPSTRPENPDDRWPRFA